MRNNKYKAFSSERSYVCMYECMYSPAAIIVMIMIMVVIKMTFPTEATFFIKANSFFSSFLLHITSTSK